MTGQGSSPDRGLSPRRGWALAIGFGLLAVALNLFRSPHERFERFAFWDSGAELVVQDLIGRGMVPTVDFAYNYGLIAPLIGRGWYAVFGLSPGSARGLWLCASVATAVGLARIASAQNLGWLGIALMAAALPDLLLPAEISLVHALEPAVITWALAEQARGRRASALALATLALFVKPAMGYFLGLALIVLALLDARGKDRGAWPRELAPAAIVGSLLALLLADVFGLSPLTRTLFPAGGLALYRESRYGFFFGVGRDFWILPGGSIRDYLRFETGFWLIGTVILAVAGLSALARLARRGGGDPQSTQKNTIHDQLIATCAWMHLSFVTLFFGHRGSWPYYFCVLVVGLAMLSQRGRSWHLAVALVLVLMLVSDRSKAMTTWREWSHMTRSKATLGLWASPEEAEEWVEILRLTAGERPAVLAPHEGAALLAPGFAPPVGTDYMPGYPLPVELARKVEQLQQATTIIEPRLAGWNGLNRYPALKHALDGCEVRWRGRHYTLHQRSTSQ